MNSDYHIDFFAVGHSFIIELLIFGFVFFLIEKIRPAEKSTTFIKKEFWQELGFASLNTILLIPIYTLMIGGVFYFVIDPFIPFQAFDPWLTALPLSIQMFVGAFILDFATYWRHRYTHRYMWPFHSIHHSAQEITWITSLRLHPIDIFVAIIFNTIVLHIIGFGGDGIAMAHVLALFFNYLTHANLDLKFPKPWRYIFASPHFHRWHHATDKKAYDKNFCAMYSLLDVMFGTYYHPEELPGEYGLSKTEQKIYETPFLKQLAYPFKKYFR